MGVASGMPADPDLLPILRRYIPDDSPWQVTAIGRQEIWDLHRRTAEMGGHLRTGVEDTFYLPDGERCRGNGDLIEHLVAIAQQAGRTVASPAQARQPRPASTCGAAAQAAAAAVQAAGSPAPAGAHRSYTDLLDQYMVRSSSKAKPARTGTPGRAGRKDAAQH